MSIIFYFITFMRVVFSPIIKSKSPASVKLFNCSFTKEISALSMTKLTVFVFSCVPPKIALSKILSFLFRAIKSGSCLFPYSSGITKVMLHATCNCCGFFNPSSSSPSITATPIRLPINTSSPKVSGKRDHNS